MLVRAVVNFVPLALAICRIDKVYRRRTGDELATEKDRQGWASRDDSDERQEVFRSRVDDHWMSEPEFREEYRMLRKEANGQVFSSRKGFKRAQPRLKCIGYLQTDRRRIPVTWLEQGGELVQIPLRRAEKILG